MIISNKSLFLKPLEYSISNYLVDYIVNVYFPSNPIGLEIHNAKRTYYLNRFPYPFSIVLSNIIPLPVVYFYYSIIEVDYEDIPEEVKLYGDILL